MRAGRSPALTPSQLATAKKERAGGRGVAAIAKDLQVHRATLYRYLADEDRVLRLAPVLAERQGRPKRKQ